MKVKLVTLLLIAVFFTDVHCQEYIGQAPNALDGLKYRTDSRAEKIEGSSLLKEEWQSGVITILKGNNTVEYKLDYLKYDLIRKIVLFKKDNDVFSVPATTRIIKFSLENEWFISLYDPDAFENIFFEVLIEGKDLLLLKKHRCSIVEGKKSDGIVAAIPDKYRTYTSYYTKIGDRQVEKIKLRKNQFTELFPEKQNAIENFIKANKLKTKNEEDLIEIFNYIVNGD